MPTRGALLAEIDESTASRGLLQPISTIALRCGLGSAVLRARDAIASCAFLPGEPVVAFDGRGGEIGGLVTQLAAGPIVPTADAPRLRAAIFA